MDSSNAACVRGEVRLISSTSRRSAQATDSRHRFHRKRFRDSGHSFNERVAAANKHRKELVGNLTLPDNNLRKFAANMVCQAREVFHD
jgi:hypothetical protein